MNAEFNWWLLIVGLVVGAGLVWFVLMDSRRRDVDVDADEMTREAAWLSAILADEGWDVPPEATTRLLALHRSYLEAPPPDEVIEGAGRAAPLPDDVGPPEVAGEVGRSPASEGGRSPEVGRSPASELPGDDRVGLGT